MKKARQHLPLVLMISSLILLLAFEFLWLEKSYREEIASLNRETDLLFTASINELEDSLFQERFILPLNAVMNDSSHNHFSQIRIESEFSTEDHIFGKRSEPAFSKSLLDSVAFWVKKSDGTNSFRKQKSGSISLFVKAQNGKTEGVRLEADTLMVIESNASRGRGPDLPFLIKRRFDRAIDGSNIDLTYEVVTLDSAEEKYSGLTTSGYFDLPSGERYGVNFPEYRPYIFQKLLPQILFCLVLFGSIALAFFLSFRSLQKQKRLNQLKNDFISNVTHELKTPITTVGVAIEALRNFNALQDPAKTDEYLAISKQELNRLSILVDRVLKMSLFDQQAPELKIETLDVKQLSEGILRSMKLQFEKYGAEVEANFEGEGFELEGDRGHLTSVLYNLIDNALKYGGNKPHLTLSIQAQTNLIRIEVKDNGIGIPKAYQDRIFEKFFRVPSGDRHNIKGHGLGLSYVSSVVAQHQGSIHFDSAEGQGTSFIIQLPRKHG